MYTFSLKSNVTLISLPVNVFNTFVKFVAVYSQNVNVTGRATEGKNDMPVLVWSLGSGDHLALHIHI